MVKSFGKTAHSPRLIKAYKHGWPRHAVNAMIVRKMKKGLFQVRAQGVEQLRATLDAEPGGVLFLANHSSWWDFFLAHYLNTAIPVDGYGMTEHSNMLKFGFFRRIGAFSIDRTDPASVRASIEYTAELLNGPRAGVWLFPQGKIICNNARPLEFQAGLRVLLAKAGRLRIVPTALRYEFWQDERPEACVRFGAPVWVDKSERATLIVDWQERLTTELDSLTADVLTQDANRFTSLFTGQESVHNRFSRLTRWIRGQEDERTTKQV